VNEQQNSTVALRLYELANAGKIDDIADLVTADYDEHDPLPGQGTGREGVVDRFSMLASALASQFTVEDVIAADDRVVVRWTNSGTHIGEFAGLPASGGTFSISGIDIYRLADGKLAEHWHVVDQLSMLAQLGFMPQPSQTD
jgi:steroid delta-isomerase-like uncharacterized protein